jgi:hypothetical protein
MRNRITAGGGVRTSCLAMSLLAGATTLAPTAAHADPIADYVSRSGKAVCAELDKVQDGGDFFRLALTVAHDGKFTIKDAANVIGRAVTSDCPSEEPKLKLAGNSAATPPTSQAGPPDH